MSLDVHAMKQSVLYGFLPGIVTAMGGAYKDTLYEPFEFQKFMRSPIVSFLWYIIIDKKYPRQSVLLKIGLASMMERVTVESYKAFRGKIPGKFNNCTVVDNKCFLQKDSNWFVDRVRGMKKYPGINVQDQTTMD